MLRKGFIEILAVFGIVFVAIMGNLVYKKVTNAPDDNPVEEIAEDVIKKHTGVDVDLSPSSPEKLA